MISLGTAISMVASAVGGFLVYIFGGWDVWLQFLLIVMFLDILTGILKSVYKKSEKTQSGGFRSSVFLKGLIRKGASLCVVVVAVQVDVIFLEMGTPMDIALIGSIRNAVILFFWLGEVVSILENCGEMGMRLPKPLIKALDVLDDRLQGDEDEES